MAVTQLDTEAQNGRDGRDGEMNGWKVGGMIVGKEWMIDGISRTDEDGRVDGRR